MTGLLLVAAALPASGAPLLTSNQMARVQDALWLLNMTTNDAGFAKDLAEPRLALPRLRSLLHAPLALPGLADEILQGVDAGSAGEWALAAGLLELEPASSFVLEAPTLDFSECALDPSLQQVLAVFYRKVAQAQARLDRAFAAWSLADKTDLAAKFLAETFNAEDLPAVRRELQQTAPFTAALIDHVIAESNAIDPAPAVSNALDTIERLRMPELVAAGTVLGEALAMLHDELADVVWPADLTILNTDLGDIVIGTPEDDRYVWPALLIVDPGGDDRYDDGVACANGLVGHPISVILDLAGDDQYVTSNLLGAGSAVFGAQLLLDVAGNDLYRSAYMGQGAGLYGVARLDDRGGDDIYRARAFAQGAGECGVGLLCDQSGRDIYDVGFCGQAYAGLQGIGLLHDVAGADHYLAGGQRPDYDRYPQRYLSLAQGCAVGARPFGGGGIAALIDDAGNDAYVADVYGQGVGYWYSAGLLIDRGGLDTYDVYEYGQGAGIHLSLGLLADLAGTDRYSGYSLCQGASHDFAVGMLLEQDGSDIYTADHHSQGRAINNAFALLLDQAGHDAYLASDTNQCQAIGDLGGLREYSSLALLLDLAGTDRYSCGAQDGARLQRPDVGLLYDLAAPAEAIP
ncbi:MAG: hypothetical protein O3A51_01955 [Verrucomicrobia bacterium]|nr:hypothetical protein [Verrucomicrobiota bacterium]